MDRDYILALLDAAIDDCIHRDWDIADNANWNAMSDNLKTIKKFIEEHQCIKPSSLLC